MPPTTLVAVMLDNSGGAYYHDTQKRADTN